MKLRRILLGAAVVALMAACGGKTETTTETVEETQTEAVAEPVVEEEAEAPAQTTQSTAKPAENKTTAKEQTPVVDPCEAKVKSFEKFVDEFKAASNNKGNGAAALKTFAEMKKKAAEQEAAVKECVSNPDYKTRVQNAIMTCKKLRG